MTAPDIPRPTLDEAWAAAEAALPEGWWIDALTHNRLTGADVHPGGKPCSGWTVAAQKNVGRLHWYRVVGSGLSPAIALRSLAERLTERPW